MNSPVHYSSFFLFFFFVCFADLGLCSSSLPDHYIDARSHPVGPYTYTEYFELSPPLRTQYLVPTYTLLLLKYDFKNTTGFAITVPYWPPFECPSPWLSVVLQFRGACQGVQDDRIVGIWLEGVEILRTSTAQPTESGVFWTVEKDVTKYNSLLVRDNLMLTVMLENTVDDVFTGFYHVEISLLYYGLWLDRSSGTSTSSQPDKGGAVNRPKWNRRSLLGWSEETGSTVNENQEVKLELQKEDWRGKSDGVSNSWDNTVQGEVKEDWGGKSDGGGNSWENTVAGGQEEVKSEGKKEEWGAKKEDWGTKSDAGGNSWGQEVKLELKKEDWETKKNDWGARNDGGGNSWDNTVVEGQEAKKEDWGAKKEHWGAKNEDWGARKEDWGAKNEDWGTKKEDWGAKNEARGTKKEDWGAKNEARGTKKEDWGTQNEDWGAKNEDWGAKNDGGSNSRDNTVVEGQEKVKLELNKEDWGAKNDGGGNSWENTQGQEQVNLQLQNEDWGAKSDGGDNTVAKGQEDANLQSAIKEDWGAAIGDGGNSIKTEDSDDERKSREFRSNQPSHGRLQSGSKLDIFYEKPADLIIPISSGGSMGFWFKIKNESDVHSKEIWVPRNAYRAVLEIYVSAHAYDEFWYSNLPTEYFIQNNLTSERINGAFRQVFVTIDDLFVGSAEPFPVIYSGGINPLLWEPIVGIGAFELPTYDLDLTPFLTFLIDGNSHFIRLGVADAVSYWLVDANLHLWLDPFWPIVTAGTIRYKSPDLKIKRKTKIKHLDGKFEVEAERKSEFSGWVCYSAGTFTTQVSYEFKFKNEIEIEGHGTHTDIEQKVKTKTEVKIEDRKREHSRTVARIKGKYPLRIRVSTMPGLAFNTYLSITNVINGLEIKCSVSLPYERKSSNLANRQESGGWIVARDHFVLSGTGNTRQKLRYKGENGCYYQAVKAETGVILENVVVTVCDDVYAW